MPEKDAAMSLSDFGWTDALAGVFAPHSPAGMEPARVVCELRRNFYAVQLDSGEMLGECGGGFFHLARTPGQFPAIGDWVGVTRRPDGSRVDIRVVLPRRTKLSRRAAGTEEQEQIVAANVDTVFVVCGLDNNFNLRRIQRFVVAVREGGAEPVVLLNKSDLADDAEALREAVAEAAPGVTIHLTSAETRRGLKALQERHVLRGRTLAFVGSSGTGKSSLVNALLREDALPVGEVREGDSKGRHTTTRRELVLTRSGALLIDTPGLRELQFWDADAAVGESFADIVDRALHCRFTNCRHENEKGCAVREAIASGELSEDRLVAYRKLKDETEARARVHRRPSALASKPGWRQREDGAKPFRYRHQEED
ncbi:MAG: ribosome small subunit-dependent GTPase A [Opitutaceae bacterium]|nr:ribosome small subunit-dependent GTPase A [Opitutaceae bacterium]